MYKRTVILMTWMVCLAFLAGCTHVVNLKPGEYPGHGEKIVEVQTLDGTIIEFDEVGGCYTLAGTAITGLARTLPTHATQVWGERLPVPRSAYAPRAVPADSVTQYWVKRTDDVAAGIFAVVAVGVVIGVVAALESKDSCPFVYSYDGDQYVFDAEPLGGAICRGLRRADCSRLDHLQAVAGEYRLLLRNEVNETQYLDAMRLRVVDHAPDQWIVPDLAGALHVVSQALPPQSAHDENGRDIAPLLRDRGGAAWLTHMPALSATEADLRHHLTVQFPKPPDARRARLVYNAGTALWGSNMIREMLQLRGDAVDAWYEELNRGGERMTELALWNLREELYLLKVRVAWDSTWVDRGWIHGGGPFLAEDRVVEFDVSELPGATLTLRLDPPKGFWTLDYMSVEYDRDSVATAQTLTLERGSDQDGRDISGSLRESDGEYYIMPRNGNWAELTFAALPPVANGWVRSVFLETDGYYEIQTDKRQPEETAQVQRLLREPGAIVSYSIERYLEWRQEQASLEK